MGAGSWEAGTVDEGAALLVSIGNGFPVTIPREAAPACAASPAPGPINAFVLSVKLRLRQGEGEFCQTKYS